MTLPLSGTEKGRDGPLGRSSEADLVPVGPTARRHVSPAVLVASLAIVYSAAASLGLWFAPVHKSVTLVWPPTGIALVALLLFGYRLWPGIAVGAFLVNAATGVGVAVAAGIAAGNTLEALTGTYLLRRLPRFRPSLERPQDVFEFVALAGMLATTISATIGVASLCLGAAAPWSLAGTLWWQWWLGDTMGAIVVAPVLLTWAARPQITWQLQRVGEAAALLAMQASASAIVFGGWFRTGTTYPPLTIAVFPFAIWAALRFGQREAATMTLLVWGIATWNTARQIGPFAATPPIERFFWLQIFMGVVAVTALVLGAAMGGRRRIEAALQQSERRYRELFENATDMVYTTDLQGRFGSLNKRGEEICGYTREELLGMNFAQLATSASAALVRRMIERQAVEPAPILYELEILAKDGRRVPLEIGTRLITEGGQAVRVQGIGRDVTERRQAAAALEDANRKLTDWVNELEERGRQATLHGEMSDLLQSCLTVEEAYTVIGAFMPKFFPSRSGALGILSASRNHVAIVAQWGNSPPGDRAFPPDQCWALRRGRAHRGEAPGTGIVCGHLNASQSTDSLCVPMMAHGEPLGILQLAGDLFQVGAASQMPEALQGSQQQLAVTLAEHCSLALANLRLRETLRNQSILDPLTGLFNRRCMEETLELEFARATRGHRSIGIIMIDIDHFKRLNDSLGHEAGDEVLRALAALLRSRVREGDIACRYGGEEFVLILPEAPLDLARARAEELREQVKRLLVPYRDQLVGPVSVSVGVAAFPDHGKTALMLLRAVDAALYRAKAAGRDRVEVAE